jgi:hypothetical protein
VPVPAAPPTAVATGKEEVAAVSAAQPELPASYVPPCEVTNEFASSADEGLRDLSPPPVVRPAPLYAAESEERSVVERSAEDAGRRPATRLGAFDGPITRAYVLKVLGISAAVSAAGFAAIFLYTGRTHTPASAAAPSDEPRPTIVSQAATEGSVPMSAPALPGAPDVAAGVPPPASSTAGTAAASAEPQEESPASTADARQLPAPSSSTPPGDVAQRTFSDTRASGSRAAPLGPSPRPRPVGTVPPSTIPDPFLTSNDRGAPASRTRTSPAGPASARPKELDVGKFLDR